MNLVRLRESIKDHEGYRKLPYFDSLGKTTVGYGHLIHHLDLDSFPSRTVGELMEYLSDSANHSLWLTEDIEQAIAIARKWFKDIWSDLPDVRREVLAEMAFQLGNRVWQFQKFHAAVLAGDHRQAIAELRDSRWYRQTPNRVEALIQTWEQP